MMYPRFGIHWVHNLQEHGIIICSESMGPRNGTTRGSDSWCIISISTFLGLMLPIRKFDKVSAKLTFSPNYCSSVAKKL